MSGQVQHNGILAGRTSCMGAPVERLVRKGGRGGVGLISRVERRDQVWSTRPSASGSGRILFCPGKRKQKGQLRPDGAVELTAKKEEKGNWSERRGFKKTFQGNTLYGSGAPSTGGDTYTQEGGKTLQMPSKKDPGAPAKETNIRQRNPIEETLLIHEHALGEGKTHGYHREVRREPKRRVHLAQCSHPIFIRERVET